jgi:hypothetical protein
LDDAEGIGVRLKPDHRRQRRHPDRAPTGLRPVDGPEGGAVESRAADWPW